MYCNAFIIYRNSSLLGLEGRIIDFNIVNRSIEGFQTTETVSLFTKLV